MTITSSKITDNTEYYDLCNDVWLFRRLRERRKQSHCNYNIGNILEHGACSTIKSIHCPYPVPGHYDNKSILRDPDNLDYRPLPDSDLISKGVGPYGKESMNHGGVYWIPGSQEIGSSFPISPDGTSTAKCNAHLMWLSG